MNFIRPKQLFLSVTLSVVTFSFLSTGQLLGDGPNLPGFEARRGGAKAPQPGAKPLPAKNPSAADVPGSLKKDLTDQLEQAKERLRQIREGKHVELDNARKALDDINDPRHVEELNQQREDAIQHIAEQKEVDLEEYRRVEERFSRGIEDLEAERKAARDRLSQAEEESSLVRDLAGRDFGDEQKQTQNQELKIDELEQKLEDLNSGGQKSTEKELTELIDDKMAERDRIEREMLGDDLHPFKDLFTLLKLHDQLTREIMELMQKLNRLRAGLGVDSGATTTGTPETSPSTSPSGNKKGQRGRGKQPKSRDKSPRDTSGSSSAVTPENPAKGERLTRFLNAVQTYNQFHQQFGGVSGYGRPSLMRSQYVPPQYQTGPSQPQGQSDQRGVPAPTRSTPNTVTTPPLSRLPGNTKTPTTVSPVPTRPRDVTITPQFTPRAVTTPKNAPRVSPVQPATTAPRTSAITPRIVTPTARPAVNVRPVQPVQQVRPVQQFQQFQQGTVKPILLPRF